MRKTTRLPFEMMTDEQGSVLPLFGLMATIAVAAVGGALDFGVAYQQRSKMQNALDAAVISGLAVYASTDSWSAATTEAQNSFGAHYSSIVQQNSSGTATASAGVPVVSFTNSGTSMSGSATIASISPFMQLVLGRNLSLTASSTAALSGANSSFSTGNSVEVAMMVDLTGSMGLTVGSTTKIAALKAAGLSLTDILLPASGANDDYVKVAIAPFADYVNASTYASEVTGLAATASASSTSTYANATDLAHTGHGAFTGTYSGVTGNASGSQSGSTPSSSQSGSGVVAVATGPSAGTSVTSGGGTYTSGYCANPTYTTVPYMQYNGATVAYYFGSSSGGTVQVPTGLYQASSSNVFEEINYVSGSTWNYVGSDNSTRDYFVPVPASTTGLSVQQYTGTVTTGRSRSSATYDVGFPVTVNNVTAGSSVAHLKYGNFWSPQNAGGGAFSSYLAESGYYLPLYTSYGSLTATTSTYSGCESATQTATLPTPPSLSLISCVTERINMSDNSLNFTDAAPGTTSYIGAYSAGSTLKSNYSSNGKCNVAGRELAPVVPLTNSRTTIQNFFNGPSGNGPLIGGGTPGHLGTQWAWYLLSPNWSSIWPSSSQPADYGSTTVKKYAILMTDGEYNEQYYTKDTTSSPMSIATDAGTTDVTATCGTTTCTSIPSSVAAGTSMTVSATKPATSTGQSSFNQALTWCNAMKAKGITVITVGFGYASNNGTYSSTSRTGTSQTIPTSLSNTNGEANAVYLLSQCASPAAAGAHANYYFPYSQSDLANTFSQIGAAVTATTTTTIKGGVITN